MDIDTISEKIVAGDRRALSRAITLVESSRKDHREQAALLMERLKGAERQAIRIGMSGTPGVGKSTFIESFGTMLTAQGLRVAVLAVDPSSARSGGSILGDKTRMEQLSRDPNAFIRPSPSADRIWAASRGAAARPWRLCEAAGFDVVLIETVGVGQSETVVAEMSDLFILLLAPAGGDELQGVKRGIMEIADIILVNKADGDLKPAATRTCTDYAGALRLLRKRPQDPAGFPKAMMVSAMQQEGLEKAWEEMTALVEWRRENGFFDARREEQARYWFEQEVRNGLLARLETPQAREAMQDYAARVAEGTITPTVAAQEMLDGLKG